MFKKGTKEVLFWGAAWGIIEATLGWFLHFIHLPGKGIILFSLGMICMMNGVFRTNKPIAAFGIALVAALIKLMNLFIPIPVLFAYHVLNPTISIILEGLMLTLFAAVFIYPTKKQYSNSEMIGGAVSAVFMYSILFRGWQTLVQYISYTNPLLQKTSVMNSLFYYLWSSLIIGVILFVTVLVLRKRESSPFNIQWRYALGMIISAIALNIML